MHALPWLVMLLAGGGPGARPQPGDAAPAFQAPSTAGTSVRLSDFQGKKTVVLAFFPKAFTPG